MARQEFLANVRSARDLFYHSATPGGHAPATPWLTPKTVEGFDEDDFPELGFDRLGELSAAVRELSEVADEVSPTAPATPAQFNAATDGFTRMLTILKPYLTTAAEGNHAHETFAGVD